MEIVKNPWKPLLLELVSSSKNSIRITTPFLKKNVIGEIAAVKNSNVKLSLVTSFNLMHFYSHVSDIDALEILLNNKCKLFNYQRLHSKIYIFDESSVVITSGNLTLGGLEKNYEYGVLINDSSSIISVIKDYNALLSNEETGVIGINEISQAKEILSKVPKSKPITLPVISTEKDADIHEVFTGGTEAILSSLKGWKLEVFKCLLEITEQEFKLEKLNQFVSRLQKKYPSNQNVEAKIRQQLQILRDIGLIKFMGSGKYKKLWT